MVDSYTNRNIFKQYWDSLTEYRISAKQRAEDQVKAYNYLKDKMELIPFADLDNSVCVGFSDGALAALWLQNSLYPNYWKFSHALYPPLKNKFSENLNNGLRVNNLKIYVGELDDWTPAKYCLEFQKKTNCQIKIFKNTYHSFSKPGIDHFYSSIFNDKGEKGVTCKYNKDATEHTMNTVFGINQ